MANYLFCHKELGKEYDLSDLNELIEKTPDYKISYDTNYLLYKLLEDTNYLKNAFDLIIKLNRT